MFEFKHINKTFQKDFWAKPFHALTDVSFKIGEGELIGFLGANGAGKTTSLKILMGFIKPKSGEVKFSEKLGLKRKEIFSQIGYLPERPYFYPHLTGKEFVTYMGRLNEVPASVIKSQMDKWAKRFDIYHALDRKIHGYSKGMLQRLGFVSSLVHEPQFLILDEPLSGLDPLGRKEIKDVLKELHAQGKTIFFSSHIVSDVEEICQSVVVLEKGHLLYEGSIKKMIANHMTPSFRIKLLDENGRNQILDVEENIKDETLKQLVEQNRTIIGVEQNRPTLEEIVYKINSN